MKKKALTSMIALVLSLLMTTSALACTGTYVGKDVSADGTTLVARTEDYSGADTKLFVVYPQTRNNPGNMYESPVSNFKYPLPDVSLKYTGFPESNPEYGGGIYDEAGFNAYGVAMSATESVSSSDIVYEADPLVDDGIAEGDMPTVILPQVKTAREGIELLGKIIEEYGTSEGNTLVIADQNEAWYMETLSGHRYAAVKMPEDMVGTYANGLMLGYVDVNDKENVIASPDLVDFVKQLGVYKEYNGKFHVALSYYGPIDDYNRTRVWYMQSVLAPSQNIPYDAEVFDLFIKPDNKVGLKDVMEIQRSRFEGTFLDKDLPENIDVRVIGVQTQQECHILQIRHDVPKEIAGKIWVAMGNAEHAVYLPYYSNITDTHEEYKFRTDDYNQDSAYYTFRGLSVLCQMDRPRYGENIRRFWSAYEDNLIAAQPELDKQVAELYAQDPFECAKFTTEQGITQADEALQIAHGFFSELFTYIARDVARTQKEPFLPSVMVVEEPAEPAEAAAYDPAELSAPVEPVADEPAELSEPAEPAE